MELPQSAAQRAQLARPRQPAADLSYGCLVAFEERRWVGSLAGVVAVLVLGRACTAFSTGSSASTASSDGGSPPDGEKEAAAEPDPDPIPEPIPPGPYCSAVAPITDAGVMDFCADFDAPDAGLAGWQVVDNDPQSRYALDSESISAPFSARLEIFRGDGGSPDARIRRIAGKRRSFLVQAKAKIARAGTKPIVPWLSIGFGDASFQVLFDGRLRRVSNVDGGTVMATVLDTQPLPSSVWFDVALGIDVDSNTLTLTINDQTRSAVLPTDVVTAQTSVVSLGPAEAESPTDGWVVLFDNVIARGRP